VGMNLEDTIDDRPDLLADLSLQKEKIHAVLETSARAGVPLVLQRTHGRISGQYRRYRDAARRTIERLNAYQDAGAQCLFAPGVKTKKPSRNW